MEELFTPYQYNELALTKGVSPNNPLTNVGEWKKLKEDLAMQGKYLTGSWGVWQDQAETYIDCVENITREKGTKLSILRLGISTPEALNQELNLLEIGGVELQKSTVTVIDFNRVPLIAAKKQKHKNLFQADANVLPFIEKAFNFITSHFLISYLQAGKCDSILLEIYRGLKTDGTFIMAQGVGSGLNNWRSSEDILQSLIKAGFKKERIKTIPTTDPYDHEEIDGKLVPKKGIN